MSSSEPATGPSAADTPAGAAGPRQVRVVGTGLIGCSVGLALRARGVPVTLADTDPAHLRVAVSLGAGTAAAGDSPAPELVVVAVPPEAAGAVVATMLDRWSRAVVTDVASVKTRVLADVAVRCGGAAPARYCGSHPMAGSEQSGPLAARADLFDGRAWAVTPHPTAAAAAVAAVHWLATQCGATPLRMTPADHDEAVALVSHLPHLASATVAGLLADAPPDHLALAGQGLRDVTRVAAGEPALWQQILRANAPAVAAWARRAATELARYADSLEDGAADLRPLLARGVAGVARLPGKHGQGPTQFAAVAVLVPDKPGELARLLADVGAAGVNVEDLRIDHAPSAPEGVVEIWARPDAVPGLLAVLDRHGWVVHR